MLVANRNDVLDLGLGDLLQWHKSRTARGGFFVPVVQPSPIFKVQGEPMQTVQPANRGNDP
jgi:hypothetical protein